jgi:hypothetical protein
MLSALVSLAVALSPAATDSGYRFAHSLAEGGRRPAVGAAERSAHLRVAHAFRRAGLQVGFERFGVRARGVRAMLWVCSTRLRAA